MILLMAAIEFYHNRLEKLQDLLRIDLKIERRDDTLVICGVQFHPIQKFGFYAGEPKGRGILVRGLSEEEAKYCEANRISYFSGKDRLKIFKETQTVSIEPRKRLAFRRRHPIREIGIREFGRFPPYTLIISPNGFKILDALFIHPRERLRDYRSGLAFAKHFGVNQPKLSKIMRTLKVQKVFDLRNAIAELPDEWWKLALSDKSTFKGLTKFFQAATPHYSLLDIKKKDVFEDFRKDEVFRTLVPGPLDVARKFGYLRDDDLSIWGSREAFHRLKAKYKLIPGVEKAKSIWLLAIPKYGMEAEAIVSTIAPYPGVPRLNMFRAVWDLGFGTERLREIQLFILKEAMNAV
ncbi:MAG: hypothetical protein C5B49_00430 [Bdellovibrio sp.]|nr:MAG: hypothetical protein C5B49_00430 [Bdellovibrio sp.]